LEAKIEKGENKRCDPPSPSLDAVRIFLRLPRRDIAYFKFVLESYEGMAVVRTEDKRAGIVMLLVAPDFMQEIEGLLEELGREIAIEVVAGPLAP